MSGEDNYRIYTRSHPNSTVKVCSAYDTQKWGKLVLPALFNFQILNLIFN